MSILSIFDKGGWFIDIETLELFSFSRISSLEFIFEVTLFKKSFGCLKMFDFVALFEKDLWTADFPRFLDKVLT